MLKFQATLQSLTRRMKQIPEWAKQHRRQCGTFLASLLIHSLIALLLSLWMIQPEFTEQIFTLIAGATKPAEDIAFVEVAEIVQPESLDRTDLDSTMKQLLSDANDGLNSHEMDDPLDRKFQITSDLLSAGLEIPVHLGEFGGRSKAGRQAAVHRFGGTANSEKAVNSGLKWLASIQREDGSWSFSEVGQAGSPGAMGQTDMGATALALLCFLGGGHTHTTNGEYRELVTKGLEYLRKNAELFSYGADLRGTYQGNSGMYVQGIASICICEAAAMSPDDQELRKLAINSIDFIERAQDRESGGWRYSPNTEGDTSVVGWQVMALQSAKASQIRIDRGVTRKIRLFLRSVEVDDGASYKYMADRGGPTPSMSAVGLLCQMYLGWKREHPALVRGVERLSAIGPSRQDVYYNYYASQVMHHFGGEAWDNWNGKMRPWLVETQVSEGPGAGSWDVTDPHGSSGGRIYQTALSILTLEVYYRHLPIYRELDHSENEP